MHIELLKGPVTIPFAGFAVGLRDPKRGETFVAEVKLTPQSNEKHKRKLAVEGINSYTGAVIASLVK